MTLTTPEKEAIVIALNHYLLDEYHRLADYWNIVDHRSLVEEGVYMYPCPVQKIYLDEENYAVTYDRQTVWTVYLNEEGNVLCDTTSNNPTPPQEYDSVKREVYYDFRETIPDTPVDDTVNANVATFVADYEWKRSTSGGGGVRG